MWFCNFSFGKNLKMKPIYPNIKNSKYFFFPVLFIALFRHHEILNDLPPLKTHYSKIALKCPLYNKLHRKLSIISFPSSFILKTYGMLVQHFVSPIFPANFGQLLPTAGYPIPGIAAGASVLLAHNRPFGGKEESR